MPCEIIRAISCWDISIWQHTVALSRKLENVQRMIHSDSAKHEEFHRLNHHFQPCNTAPPDTLIDVAFINFCRVFWCVTVMTYTFRPLLVFESMNTRLHNMSLHCQGDLHPCHLTVRYNNHILIVVWCWMSYENRESFFHLFTEESTLGKTRSGNFLLVFGFFF